ncbi:MAG: ThuA domain-containing protein [Thermoguttaceae bacterium]
MKRREFLLRSGALALASTSFSLGWARAADEKKKILYFTRSVGFEHSAVALIDSGPSYSDRVLMKLGAEHDIQVVCTKDGTVFDGDLGQYAAIAFYTCGDLCAPGSKPVTPPMTPEGKQKLLKWVDAGGAFVGFHSATDSFHSQGGQNEVQKLQDRDPYIRMIGGEFIKHGPQQVATMRVTAPDFPGAGNLGPSFAWNEEWYALKNFAPDMHVILVQETKGMEGNCYQRPPFPATWARKQGQGRVFYTSLGHRHDVWDHPLFHQLVVGGFGWAMGQEEADLAPNLKQTAPECDKLSPEL